MNIETLLDAASCKLARAASYSSDTPRLDAEILLAFVLKQTRTWLHTWPDKVVDEPDLQQFNALLSRRIAGEPIAHLVGSQEFWSLELQVSPATLIPRPETERLVELALERIPTDSRYEILDLGTGCGAIALALAHERPLCHITATDQSALALELARHNAQQHQLNNVTFLHGNWFSPLENQQQFDVIVSNPPYIVENDPHLQQGDVRYEPVSALAAGPDGLDDIRQIIEGARSHLKKHGWLLLEHGYDQAQAITTMLRSQGYEMVEDFDDYAGIPRIAAARY